MFRRPTSELSDRSHSFSANISCTDPTGCIALRPFSPKHTVGNPEYPRFGCIRMQTYFRKASPIGCINEAQYVKIMQGQGLADCNS